jgi:hypothetical protein
MDKSTYAEFETRPFRIVSSYILKRMKAKSNGEMNNGIKAE